MSGIGHRVSEEFSNEHGEPMRITIDPRSNHPEYPVNIAIDGMEQRGLPSGRLTYLEAEKLRRLLEKFFEYPPSSERGRS